MIRKKKRDPIAVFVLLSILIHVTVVIILLIKDDAQNPQSQNVVEIQYIPTPPAPAVAAVTDEAAEKKKKERADIIPVKNKVVEQDKQINDEIDKTTDLLSKFNQRVEQETKAAITGKFENSAKAGKEEQGSAQGKKESDDTEVQKSAANKREKGELPDLRALSPKFALNPGQKAPEIVETGERSANDDYLKDVKTGMQTLLSTREFVYYTYYARIKDAIRQHWEPNVREKVKVIFRQGRTIASSKDRVTQVLVTLNGDGELVRVDVLTQSGVETLDSAAVEAFREAAPFPNPPKGMIEKDGTIKIRWDFVLEV